GGVVEVGGGAAVVDAGAGWVAAGCATPDIAALNAVRCVRNSCRFATASGSRPFAAGAAPPVVPTAAGAAGFDAGPISSVSSLSIAAACVPHAGDDVLAAFSSAM